MLGRHGGYRSAESEPHVTAAGRLLLILRFADRTKSSITTFGCSHKYIARIW